MTPQSLWSSSVFLLVSLWMSSPLDVVYHCFVVFWMVVLILIRYLSIKFEVMYNIKTVISWYHWLFGDLCGLIRLLVLCSTFFQLFSLLLTYEVLLSHRYLGIADEVWRLLIFTSSCISCIIFLAECNSWVSSSRIHLYSMHDLHEDVGLGTLFPSTCIGCSRQHTSPPTMFRTSVLLVCSYT
jgi:hypothetical protein